MGLSTASVRHPHVMVMAPALTKTNQSQNFKITPSSPTTQPSSLHGRDEHNVYRSIEGDSCTKSTDVGSTNLENATDNLNTLALVSEILKNNGYNNNILPIGEESDSSSGPSGIMNNSLLHMGDQKDKMGLQKASTDIVSLMKDKTANSDVDQLFNNIESVLPGTDLGGGGDITQNVEEIMQVIKSIESGNDRLGVTASDLSPEADSMFPLSGTDLTSNLSSFEKELFNDVDVMSMSMEEQLLDGAISLKESHAKDLITDLQKKHNKLERKLEFVLRRLRKIQAKQMGQHISEEIAGVFEHVHRTLRRSKDNLNTSVLEGSASTCLTQTINPSEQVVNERLKPISQNSAKNLVRKLELSTALQASAVGRQKNLARYFGSGSIESNSLRHSLVGATTIPQWTPDCKNDLQRTTGLLFTETRLVQEELDSDATVSSSGGESCDEMQPYNNPHQQYLSM